MGHSGPLLTLALAAGAGVFTFVLSARLRVPPIALLLPLGVLLGPEALGWIDPAHLGSGLSTVVGLSVAVILFEGGLALDIDGYRRAPRVIVRMLTVGVALTWAGGAAALYYLLELPLPLAAVGGSLVVVTGPTVISPILRRVGVQERLSDVLYWEAVLVDFVGVFLTVLCFEWVTSKEDIGAPTHLGYFFLRLLLGGGLGVVFGIGLEYVLRKDWVGPEHTNIFVLGAALVLFGICDALLPESGILGVIVAGLIIAIRKPPQLKRLKHFKLELTEMGIGLLFILLSANLELASFSALGWAGVAVVGVMVLVLRPLNIAVSTWGQGFTFREKLFLSWIAPRGIVAASMASLLVLELREAGYARAGVLETFAYAVIATTVLLQGLSAGWVAGFLGLSKPPRRRWLLVGEPALVGPLGEAIAEAGAPVAVLVDDVAGRGHVPGGVRWLDLDPVDADVLTDPRLLDVGHVLAISPNSHLNQLVCQLWREVLPPAAVARWAPAPGGVGGRVILADGAAWERLPTPGELAHGLESGTRVVEVLGVDSEHDLERFGPHLEPLLAIRDGDAALVGTRSSPRPTVGAGVVVLRDRVPGLAGLVSDAIVVEDPVSTVEEVIHLLLARADDEYDTDQIVKGMLDRERDMPTAMGMGVILPHTYVTGLATSRCLVAMVPGGVAGETPDGVPIRLVCLMLSPAGRAEMHLQGMAALARLLYNPAVVEHLCAQASSADLLELIRDHE